jgi:hypothetical protein
VVSFLSMSTSILQPFKTLFQIHEQAAAAQHPPHGRQTEPAKDEPQHHTLDMSSSLATRLPLH